MPRIHVLSESLRNKIAAGEVVERPASVVKELIENSLDAGCSRIVIDVARAGKKVIRVSDNGVGMDREDALLAFQRYATSKIRSADDLSEIRTMGFRGEALSSIAAVSKVKLVTVMRPHDLEALSQGRSMDSSSLLDGEDTPKDGYSGLPGTSVEIAGGETRDIRECPALGTTIEVRDLFFNTPARLKFLKSEGTENRHIVDIVTREALSHYEIGFTFRMDGQEVLNLPGSRSHRERLMQVFGKEFVDSLVETAQSTNDASIRAFLGNTTTLRNTRLSQYLFVNQRPVRDQTLTHAVYRAYEDLIPRDRHPLFLLFLEVPPHRADFNVHPTKREVRFEDAKSLFALVYQTAREALRRGGEDRAPVSGIEGLRSRKGEEVEPDTSLSVPRNLTFTSPQGAASPWGLVSEKADAPYPGAIPSLYLGDTFVALPDRGGLALIDYHAAHERINFERFLRGLTADSTPLLFPQQVRLPLSEYRAVLDNREMLEGLGMEVDDFGHSTVVVRSLPEMLRDADVATLMGDVASSLLQKDEAPEETLSGEDLQPFDSRKRRLAAKLACHSSIRGREVPDGARLAELLRSLEATEHPDRCPHGRPTRIFISLEDLKRMFKK